MARRPVSEFGELDGTTTTTTAAATGPRSKTHLLDSTTVDSRLDSHPDSGAGSSQQQARKREPWLSRNRSKHQSTSSPLLEPSRGGFYSFVQAVRRAATISSSHSWSDRTKMTATASSSQSGRGGNGDSINNRLSQHINTGFTFPTHSVGMQSKNTVNIQDLVTPMNPQTSSSLKPIASQSTRHNRSHTEPAVSKSFSSRLFHHHHHHPEASSSRGSSPCSRSQSRKHARSATVQTISAPYGLSIAAYRPVPTHSSLKRVSESMRNPDLSTLDAEHAILLRAGPSHMQYQVEELENRRLKSLSSRALPLDFDQQRDSGEDPQTSLNAGKPTGLRPILAPYSEDVHRRDNVRTHGTRWEPRTACEQMVIPRPRLVAHPLSPPDTPQINGLYTEAPESRFGLSSATAPLNKRRGPFVTFDRSHSPGTPMSGTRVMEDTVEREQERRAWAKSAESLHRPLALKTSEADAARDSSGQRNRESEDTEFGFFHSGSERRSRSRSRVPTSDNKHAPDLVIVNSRATANSKPSSTNTPPSEPLPRPPSSDAQKSSEHGTVVILDRSSSYRQQDDNALVTSPQDPPVTSPRGPPVLGPELPISPDWNSLKSPNGAASTSTHATGSVAPEPLPPATARALASRLNGTPRRKKSTIEEVVNRARSSAMMLHGEDPEVYASPQYNDAATAGGIKFYNGPSNRRQILEAAGILQASMNGSSGQLDTLNEGQEYTGSSAPTGMMASRAPNRQLAHSVSRLSLRSEKIIDEFSQYTQSKFFSRPDSTWTAPLSIAEAEDRVSSLLGPRKSTNNGFNRYSQFSRVSKESGLTYTFSTPASKVRGGGESSEEEASGENGGLEIATPEMGYDAYKGQMGLAAPFEEQGPSVHNGTMTNGDDRAGDEEADRWEDPDDLPLERPMMAGLFQGSPYVESPDHPFDRGNHVIRKTSSENTLLKVGMVPSGIPAHRSPSMDQLIDASSAKGRGSVVPDYVSENPSPALSSIHALPRKHSLSNLAAGLPSKESNSTLSSSHHQYAAIPEEDDHTPTSNDVVPSPSTPAIFWSDTSGQGDALKMMKNFPAPPGTRLVNGRHPSPPEEVILSNEGITNGHASS